MRHQSYGRKLNRDIKERKALFKSLILSLVEYGRITTTIAKGKAVIRLAEKMVTYAKDGSNASLKKISAVLNKRTSIQKLMKEIAPRFENKVGGYIRMVKKDYRKGDHAQSVLLEWSIPEEKKDKVESKDQKIKEKGNQKKVKKLNKKQ